MNVKSRPMNAPLILCTTLAGICLVMVLSACGGSSGNNGTTPPPPIGGGDGDGDQSSLPGRMWFVSSSTDPAWKGRPGLWHIAAADTTNAPTPLGPEAGMPWPDGSKYLSGRSGATGYDIIEARATTTTMPVYGVTLRQYAYGGQPSPVSKSVFSILQMPNLLTNEGTYLVADMASAQVLRAEPTSTFQYNYIWLPDGRLMRINIDTGELFTASVSEDWAPSGKITVPTNHRIGVVATNPQGTRLAYVLDDYINYSDRVRSLVADIWVSNIDGSIPEPFTSSGRSHNPIWSPDGNYIAFDHDNATCSGVGLCSGGCGGWYAPATARSIKDTILGSHHPVAKEIKFKNSDSPVTTNIGCRLSFWTQ